MATKNSASKGTKKNLSVESLKVAVLAGETYPVKDSLKAAGGIWAPSIGGWAFESPAKAAGALPKKADGISLNEVDVVAVKGDTYPVKDLLKALGGAWEPAVGAWTFPSVERAQKVIAAVKATQ